MPKKVTYGVRGLIDWHMQLTAGQAKLLIHFAGGSLTKYGSTPAEYTTSDPVVQRIIENSAQYRNGKIFTLRSCGKPDTLPTFRRTPQPPADNMQLDLSTPKPQDIPVVEVYDLEDAAEYLNTNYQVPSFKIRSHQIAQELALSHGVSFKFIQNPNES